MKRIEKSMDVHVPAHVAYEQWMHFEDFPKFMNTVEEVKRIDDKVSKWTVNISGSRREFLSTITEQIPDRLIAWINTTLPYSAGRTTFDQLGVNTTRVTLALEHETRGMMEKVASLLGWTERQVEGDLESFKGYLEATYKDRNEWPSSTHYCRVSR